VGRETVFEYASNELDFLKVKQKNGSTYDLLKEVTYNSAHRPLTVKDADAQTITHTYNGQGQILTIKTPPRAGITENRTTTYDYDEDGHLENVTGPATGATTSYTYDGYGRPDTVTDSDGYELAYDYDALDRQTRVTYADGTVEETVYDRLDPVRTRDRLGRWTHYVYDAVERLAATTDPLGRTVTQQWCACGSLEAIISPNGNRTEWERDIQGRVTQETRANGSEWLYGYEDTSSRLKTVTDPKDQVQTYSYFLDDNLQEVTYTNEEHDTPNLSFTYDLVYNRSATMTDGTGTTTYEYHPVGTSPPLGAGMLATVNGPLTNDTISYAYDELGRIVSRAINGVALTYEYDALGRIITENNVLGAFSFQYDSVTSRVETVAYPNGQTTSYAFYPNSGDHRLQEIHHRKPGGITLSKFSYSYDAVGNIKAWTQQEDANPAKAYDFEYDGTDQLRLAVWRTTDATPTILKRYAYTYDPSGNRTVEQIDNAPVLSAYDTVNQLTSQTPGGTMRFAGTLSEAATVTIQGLPATVTSDNRFERPAQVSSGTNQVIVKAKDYAGNERTNTYEISVSGSSKTFTYDANGNLTGDGTRTLEWDARNELLSISVGTYRTEFSYDGLRRRIRQIEKQNGVIQSDTHVVWCEWQICEERASDGSTVVRRAFPLGEQVGGVARFLATNHLDTVTEVTDSAGDLLSRYDFDPWGRRNLTAGTDVTTVGFAGHRWQANGSLWLTMFRGYDASLGRWLSEDPLPVTVRSFKEFNSHAYGTNSPVRYTDPYGLWVYGNYCGPGGKGPVKDDVDQCCKNHDDDYEKCGADAADQFFGWGGKTKKECMKRCDKRLCDCLAKIIVKPPTLHDTPSDKARRQGRSAVLWYFKCGSSGSGGG
jgi:RHS repeat-associated protein